MHSHLHAPDWRAHMALRGRPAGFPAGPFFGHHAAAAAAAFPTASSLRGLSGADNQQQQAHQQQQQQQQQQLAHSTTSPEGSPTTTTTTSGHTQLSAFVQPPIGCSSPVLAPLTSLQDNDNNNNTNNNSNIDAGFESDSISVTGSPRKSLGSPLTHDEEETDSISREENTNHNNGIGGSLGESSPGSGGAFTALIQRSKNPTDLFGGFAGTGSGNHFPPAHSFNPALAAQLFLQSPLLPQSSQWLYSQLYGSYSDLPWLRNAAAAAAASNLNPNTTPTPEGVPPTSQDHDGVNLIKRCVTLITHNPPDAENANPNASPPVSSSRRSPSPVETIDLDDVSTTSRSASGASSGEAIGGAGGGLAGGGAATAAVSGVGPIRNRTPKPSADVWRPY
ncbi:uncharacterized protein RunxB isoform X2 [Drosophila bipectinata]